MNRMTTDPNDVLGISEADLPLMVFSDHMRSFFSWGIKAHECGAYNHFMWMINPHEFVSQDWALHRVPIREYLKGDHRLKFVRGTNWTPAQKIQIRVALCLALDEPLYKRLYDPLQIVGKAIWCNWLQIPGLEICSDYGYILHKTDPSYNLVHPSPTDINKWTKDRQDRYGVYLRYLPD